jgi:dTDP-glucose 4,6-dehydratase
MGKTVLITGGLGFIGTSLIQRLLQNNEYNIIIFDKTRSSSWPKHLPKDIKIRKRISIINGDITKRRSVDQAVKRADVIVHMAARTNTFGSLHHATPTVITNVLGTTMILESAAKHNIERFIFFSSSEVYGNQVENTPMDESHPLNPITPYAASKVAGEKLAHSFFLTKHLPIIIFRPFNAYGPFQTLDKMIPIFITKLLRDNPITLNHGGKPRRDWVFVDDHARAVIQALETPIEKVNGHVFNVGTGKATAIKDIATKLLILLGKDKKLLTIIPSTSSQPETMGNVGISTKIASVLGWKPQTSLDEGLGKTVEWYKENRWWWDK